jgi:hypothetical protein
MYITVWQKRQLHRTLSRMGGNQSVDPEPGVEPGDDAAGCTSRAVVQLGAAGLDQQPGDGLGRADKSAPATMGMGFRADKS